MVENIEFENRHFWNF